MSFTQNCLKILESAGFLQPRLLSASNETLCKTKLLTNGVQFASQFQHLWLTARGSCIHLEEHPTVADNKQGLCRLGFVQTPQYAKLLKNLSCKLKASLPCVAKFQQAEPHASGEDSLVKLISDYYFPSYFGLENFYNIQRESKIWWMRLSTNPSRYFVEPYDLGAEPTDTAAYAQNCQSISLKSRIRDTEIEVESLTLVPLAKVNLPNIASCNFRDSPAAPTLIRSVIKLDVALRALLLDGLDHNRNQTLLLNRKTAPYQCAVICATNLDCPETRSDLVDMRTHLLYVLRRAEIRVLDSLTESIGNSCDASLKESFRRLDKLGVPYCLLLTETTLENGLLGMRSRDTTLTETVHISYLQNYLVNILTH